jgi:hypothetical protein
MTSFDFGLRMEYIDYDRNALRTQTPDDKHTVDLKQFYDILKQLDELIVSEAFNNQFNLSSRRNNSYPNRDVVEALYIPMIKYAIDMNTGYINHAYHTTVNMKVPNMNDKFTCQFYNHDQEKFDCSSILEMNKKGARFRRIMKCNGLWFAGGEFGCSWKAIPIKIAHDVYIVGCAIIQNDTDDENKHHRR